MRNDEEGAAAGGYSLRRSRGPLSSWESHGLERPKDTLKGSRCSRAKHREATDRLWDQCKEGSNSVVMGMCTKPYLWKPRPRAR